MGNPQVNLWRRSLQRWHVDRVTVFLVIVVISFCYDLTGILGLRNPNSFPHPFFYIRSIEEIQYFKGFPRMLRQAMFLFVGGGLLGWGASLVILKNKWLTLAAIRFLRVAMWIPFLVVFAVPDTFRLGIAAATLVAIYHYLTAKFYLDYSNKEAIPYAAGETALQSLFFTLLGQAWSRRWDWLSFGATLDAQLGFVALALVLTLVLIVNFVFERSFPAGCGRRVIVSDKVSQTSNMNSLLGAVMLTIVWLLLWQVTCVSFGYDALLLFPALQKAGELLFASATWSEILIALVEVGGGIIFGGFLALLATTLMSKSILASNVAMKIFPATYLSPIVVWILVFFVVFPAGANSDWQWFRTFFIGIGHKIMGVGFLTFFPIVQACWTFRETSMPRRCLIAIADALPIAFVAMCFGELYAATAGLGFQMVIASAQSKFQEALGWFLITVVLLSVLSAVVSFIARHTGLKRLPTVAKEGIPAS